MVAWRVLAILLFCAACADKSAIDAARKETGDAYAACLRLAANSLDNGTQDAMTVAYAVKARCGPKFLEWRRAFASDLTGPYQTAFMAQDTTAEQLDFAMTAVSSQRTKSAQSLH